MADSIHRLSDRWLSPAGPDSGMVVSSRCRLARNLAGLPFTRTAQPSQLDLVGRRIMEVITSEARFEDFRRIVLGDISASDRAILRESHLISPELERDSRHCAVFLSADARISIMINEEDHLRMQAIEAGHRVDEVHRAIGEVDDILSTHLHFAFSPRWGYLTACPTNTGTGLRASVMMHLPGLVLADKIERVIKSVASHSFAVRGIYGEGTNCAGDLYQISNEVTLGKSEVDILRGLLGVVDELIKLEGAARSELFEKRPAFVEDSIWRSYATLSQARMIDSSEAIGLLSRLRLGIDRGHFNAQLTHDDLNRLIIEIQPAHLMVRVPTSGNSESRDTARADYLRRRLADVISDN